MSTTTSSEEKVDHHDARQPEYDTVDENDRRTMQNADTDEPERKRRRIATEKARVLRMQSYANARMKEMDSGKSQGSNSRLRTPSVEPSASRSDDGSRSSPMRRAYPSRVGKRVRRKPQRWEGERLQRAAPVKPREDSVPDGESTASVQSAYSVADPPIIDSPFEDLQHALEQCSGLHNRREIVDAFHSWQLKTVSKQAAQQKALHVFLKRRLRKRNTRSPEYDRVEDEALRNARSPHDVHRKGSVESDNADQDTTIEDEINRDFVVPYKLRLPLEAYLPRRVRPRGNETWPEDIFRSLPHAPHFPGSEIQLDDAGEQKWMTLPTVAASAEWNTRKSNVRRKAAEVKTELSSAKNSNDGETQD